MKRTEILDRVVENMDEEQILNKYKEVLLGLMPLQFPGIDVRELSDAIDYSIKKRLYNGKAKIKNDYLDKTVEINVVDLCNYILSRKPILTASGVMFKKHDDAPNPLISLITSFLNKRKEYKKMMFSFPKGSEDFDKYNLLQLLKKIDVNGLYGALGNANCILYSLHVASSITTQARSCISSAGLQFEMFLANGCPFTSFNEIMTFVYNVIRERPERKWKDSDLGLRNVNVAEVFTKLVKSVGFRNYIPSEKQCNILFDLLNRLDQEDLNRIYYKNNLYEFASNRSITNMVICMLESMNEPYMDPNKPPEGLEVEIDVFKSVMMEYVYYHHQIIDRLDKYNFINRSVCVITDTDSTIISVDAWYRFIKERIQGLDLGIMHQKIDIFKKFDHDEFGDPVDAHKNEIHLDPYVSVEKDFDYDFWSDEVTEQKKMLDVMSVIPQECVRYSIVNILSYVLGNVINDYMFRYTHNTNSYKDGKKCVIDMKNEFLFKRIMLNDAKKNYATIQELQEGNVVRKADGSIGMLDIKGLQVGKSVTASKTQKKLKKIIEEDILFAGENVNFVKIIKELGLFEKQIIEAIKKGDKTLYKPKKLKSIHNYANPFSTSGIKECIVWNETKEQGIEGFDMDEENYFDMAVVNINADNVYMIKDDYPVVYEKLVNLMKRDKFEIIKGISIPKNVPVPDWVYTFIDYIQIINDNVHIMPVYALKINRGNKNNNYTNIVSI